MKREKRKAGDSIGPQVRMIRGLAADARLKWLQGARFSAYLWLKYIGLLYRMTTDSREPEESLFTALDWQKQLAALQDALLEIRVAPLCHLAGYYLSTDPRRRIKNAYFEWQNDLANHVVYPRDHYQVVLDSVTRVGADLIAGDPVVRIWLEEINEKLISLDNLLRSTPDNEQEAVSCFRARLFISPSFDLERYWWFGEKLETKQLAVL